MSRYMGIDLGTTYFKAGVYDADGRLCGLGRESVPKVCEGARCELPVADFWKAVQNAISQALSDAGIPASAIDAVSYSSQANSFVLLDASLEALTPLVLWSDTRARGGFPGLAAIASLPGFMEKTGLGIVPNEEFMPAKLEWFRSNCPQIWSRTAYVMTISDYLVYGLTGSRAGDRSTAAMTAMLDVPAGAWWPEALEAFGLKEDMLSTPLPSGTLAGRVSGRGASLAALKEGTPLYLGCLDHYAVAIGAGILAGRRLSESTGTVLACVAYREGYAPRKGVIIGPGPDGNHYFQMAFSSNGATAVEWYQKNYAPDKTILQLEDEARRVPAGCDGLKALPRSDTYPGLEGFRNVRPGHTPAHFLRAIFVSTAESLVALVDALDPERQATEVIPSGGGARNTLWLQIKEAMLHRKYLPQASGELATKGAAMICRGNVDVRIEPEGR